MTKDEYLERMRDECVKAADDILLTHFESVGSRLPEEIFDAIAPMLMEGMEEVASMGHPLDRGLEPLYRLIFPDKEQGE